MKGKTIIQIVLAVTIVALAVVLYRSITKPMKFDNEFKVRREACATKLKTIRTLEDAYKQTYGVYCGDFDTLFSRLMKEDSLLISQRVMNQEAISAAQAKDPNFDVNDVTQLEAIKKGYMKLVQTYVNPIAQLREQGKLSYKDKDGVMHEYTDEDLLNMRYVPYPKGTKNEFQLEAGMLDRSGLKVPVFECKVDLKDLMSDMDAQDVANKIASIERVPGKYAGWKVGDMTQSITDGNFE
ncbi:MAG: hypothetical protein SPJ13_04015 [Bacteroidales bacterium]|nr:hypothetical protein [Bacteroidales bacterium]